MGPRELRAAGKEGIGGREGGGGGEGEGGGEGAEKQQREEVEEDGM